MPYAQSRVMQTKAAFDWVEGNVDFAFLSPPLRNHAASSAYNLGSEIVLEACAIGYAQ